MKKLAKKLVTQVLGWQVRRLQKKNKIVTIGVSGSIGKTSTKFAIAAVLGHSKNVLFQSGNYNDIVTVPLVFFGRAAPKLFNPFAWVALFVKNETQLRKPYPYDIVVIELGTDGPGQIKQFAQYLHLDMAVVTAITPEHMEFFETIEQVADEEFALAAFSDKVVVNADLCGGFIPPGEKLPVATYGFNNTSNYVIETSMDGANRSRLTVTKNGKILFEGEQPLEGIAGAYSASAATAVACELDMPLREIAEGIKNIKPVNGRLRRLAGVKQSVIIDDTYNSSPAAVIAALDVLYASSAPQRIALLGNMNELGKFAESAHREVGEYCRPDKLDLVATLGPEANEYLADAAEKRGCQVKRFHSPIEAGEFIREFIKPGALILAKGSQNGVFAEEAVKILLAEQGDQQFLVRQTPEWMAKKAKFLRSKVP